MTQVAQVMTSGVRSMLPSDSLQFAAQAMEELNVGVIPVCDGERLIGMVTDRDITVRGVAQGCAAESTPISEVMSENVRWVFEDQSIDEATAQMQYAQIQRLPVLDRNHRLVGILALGDVASKTDGEESAEPDRSGNFGVADGMAGGLAAVQQRH